MSFIPFIRDYIELLNTVYDSLLNDISIQKIIQETILYVGETFKYIVLYILTFQWVRDILYLPILIPQISHSILKETFFLQTPLENTFTIFEIPSYNNNKLLIGFLNSFFLALPISCAHLIYLRRLLIQGNIAGIAAALGNIFGQILFIGSIIFGFRFFLIPWFSFEPLSYIIGILVLLTIIYDMVHERIIKIIDWKNQTAILQIFCLNFLLIWTEQSCIFQYFGNLTFGAEPSIIENFSTTTYGAFFSTHSTYLLGLFIGSIFFNVLFAIVFKYFTEYLQIKLSILRSTWIIRLNISLLTLTLAFTFTSIPFYGLDYLLTQPLGFISQDKSLKNTLFFPTELKDPYGILGGFSNNLSLSTDVTSFDRGNYLKLPIFETFEDLNYSGEYASKVKQGEIPLFDQYKQKARKIRELLVQKSDSEKDTNSQLAPSTPVAPTTLESKGGGLPGEPSYSIEKNIAEYPTYYPIDKNVYISSNIEKRFENSYKEPANFIFEISVQGGLNNVFANENFTVAYPEIEKKLKEKYYSNPVYQFLLNTDIDTFLKRQPKEFFLSPQEEGDLFKKRLILGRYNDSVRFYNTVPYSDEFQYFFNGSKSFADRVYNQQFKGTLHIVRRLFSISFASETKNPYQVILRYDQPLFKNAHTKADRIENAILHEEVQPTKQVSTIEKLELPFFELVGQSPLYMGWDEDLRKIIITNRLLNRSITNYFQPELNSGNALQTIQKGNGPNREPMDASPIEFTIWPLTRSTLENADATTLVNARLLFETKTSLQKLQYEKLISLFQYEDKESGISYYESLPNTIRVLQSPALVDIIPPNRGGFIWPGTHPLKFSLHDIFKL